MKIIPNHPYLGVKFRISIKWDTTARNIYYIGEIKSDAYNVHWNLMGKWVSSLIDKSTLEEHFSTGYYYKI